MVRVPFLFKGEKMLDESVKKRFFKKGTINIQIKGEQTPIYGGRTKNFTVHKRALGDYVVSHKGYMIAGGWNRRKDAKRFMFRMESAFWPIPWENVDGPGKYAEMNKPLVVDIILSLGSKDNLKRGR
jgi:hypothetical protein